MASISRAVQSTAGLGSVPDEVIIVVRVISHDMVCGPHGQLRAVLVSALIYIQAHRETCLPLHRSNGLHIDLYRAARCHFGTVNDPDALDRRI